MTRERERLEEEREQALRDLLALEVQIRTGEIPVEAGQRLRTEYERAAADAMARLDGLEKPSTRTPSRLSVARTLAYVVTVLVAGLAAAVVLPGSVQPRPANGFVTGNEVTQSSTAAAPLPAGGDAEGTALWMRANVELFDRDDPAAALRTLERLQTRPDLLPDTRRDVEALIATARRELDRSGR
ncbi:hypothetical protein NQK81_35175 [Amycolatopsis roodepoortensis]|uniref:hypothetical protein n=1 Tax=Amycolatopsis roodepoortensis TaxID=700274 RepID=UPI00214B0E9E|nr:hypothetical protein [Amycolatopsis roodepoortensis]UUV29967.1 hypothetical protein NQK81_35175 [Amycolatopsis roodepoortensis]